MQIKILSLGDEHAFSSQSYLPKIAKCDDAEIVAGCLFFDGATLENHRDAFVNDSERYTFIYNNEGSVRTNTIEKFSVYKALDWFDWDYITIQQSAEFSGDTESYFPYLSEIVSMIKEKCPKASLILNEPWAFENCNGKNTAEAIRSACIENTNRSDIRIVLPVGEAWAKAREKNFCALATDGCHASRAGEFLSASVWYEVLTGNDMTKNSYRLPFVESEITAFIKNTAHEVAERYCLVR